MYLCSSCYLTKIMYSQTIIYFCLISLSWSLTDKNFENEILKKNESQPEDKKCNVKETEADYWRNKAQATVRDKLRQLPIIGQAKNVILFLGDGMSFPTIAAARIYLGQTQNKTGEETQFSFEKFPYSGLSKTYCVDSQVADSACSATAYLGGVKNNIHTIGVTAAVDKNNCKAEQNTSNHVYSIAQWSQQHAKRTGIVTTTRVTHASPAGAFAHTANRDWESDSDVIKSNVNPHLCKDIATQLVFGETGKNLNVILGGGRGEFLPKTYTDEDGQQGYRSDTKNLIEEWEKLKTGTSYEYVWNRTSLLEVSPDTDFLLGLFDTDHMNFNLNRDPDLKPSLAEMTKAAIRVLSRGSQGFFLFVEGGLIDKAHHATKAQMALDETVEFDKAISAALKLTDPRETLIVVTADHAHTMSLNGYAPRGNDILGFAGKATDDIPYTTLSYANGKGYKKELDDKRYDISKDDTHDKDYQFPSLTPLYYETHGGDDVAIYAIGPSAHHFTGVIEQNVIPHLMAYASCVGNGITICDFHLNKLP